VPLQIRNGLAVAIEHADVNRDDGDTAAEALGRLGRRLLLLRNRRQNEARENGTGRGDTWFHVSASA
jgi:hypothetical protein